MSWFDANVRALTEAAPELASLVRRQGGVLDVAISRSGAPTASANGRSVHSAYDPWKEAVTWAEAQAAACRPGERIVVLGCGLLYHVEALCQRRGGDERIAVAVLDPRELHDACVVRDLGSWLGRVEWVHGDPEKMASALLGERRPLRVLKYQPALAPHTESCERLEVALKQGAARQAGGQLHIALVGPIYGGSLPVARYAVSALRALGHRVSWLDHSIHVASYRATESFKDPRLRQTMQARFVEWLGLMSQAAVGEDPPDLVLALAQAPLTSPILEHLRRKKFLTAMWFVENYRLFTYWKQLAGSYDFWFVIQKGACHEDLRRAGAKTVAYLPLAADPAIHRPLTLTESERDEFSSDVSFVGAGYPNRRNLFPRLVTSEWTFKLWGNEWDGADALASVLQRKGARIDTETSVKIFNATKVNLNVHSHAGTGPDPEGDFVNPRTFELAACGAFQLIDSRTLLGELFGPNDLTCFGKTEDLAPLIAASLLDDAMRASLAEAGRRRVLADHTYVHRMARLLEIVGAGAPDRVGAILRGSRAAGSLADRPEAAPDLTALLRQFPAGDRVELGDAAARLRSRGPEARFTRDELLVLMLDEYRQEVRDFA